MTMFNGIRIDQGLPDVCRPDRMALIVYDMQVGIVSQLAAGAAVVESIAHLIEAARSGGFRIIFLRHLSMPTKLMGAFQMRQAMAWQQTSDPAQVRPWFLRDAPGFQIVPELAPRADEAILDKLTFSAFESTPLSLILRDCALVSFAICGAVMEVGIDPTVRHGADLGLIPVVVEDACASGHLEAAARSISNIRFMGDAIVTSSAQVVTAMSG